MARTFPAVMSAFTAAVLLCSCGPDNVGACKEHVRTINSLSCVGYPVKDEHNCERLAGSTFDHSDYFECLTAHWVCNGDMLDEAELDKAGDCVKFLNDPPDWW